MAKNNEEKIDSLLRIRKSYGKSLWWGPFPWEKDGGAIVHYYLMKMMNYIEPKHQLHCIPKVPEQLNASELPFANFYPIKTRHLGHIPPEISQLMMQKRIPLLNLFHIPWEFFPIVDDVHDVGGVVLNHQTIHWADDVLFQSPRLKDIDYWVTPTEFAKRLLATKGGIPSENMFTIPHGVNVEKFFPHKTNLRRELGIKDDDIVILWVGRCQLTKGAHSIIPILRYIIDKYPNVHFVARAGVYKGIYKSPELGYILGRLADRHPRIHFIPQWCPPSFMEELMAMCDILLCVSGHEGFSLPPLEAMACKKPVALSAIPVHIELMGGRNNHCGILMKTDVDAEIVNAYPSNPEGTMVKVPNKELVHDTLVYLIENPDVREEMGNNGIARAKANYNLAQIAYNWLELYDKLTDNFDTDMDERMEERLLIT